MEKRVTTTFNEKWQKRHSWLTFEEENNKTLLARPLNLNCGKVKNLFFLLLSRPGSLAGRVFYTAAFGLTHPAKAVS